MKNLIINICLICFIICTALQLFSCNTNEKDKNEESDTIKRITGDETSVDIESNPILSLFKKTSELPFTIDSTYFSKLTESEDFVRLRTKEVKVLTTSFNKYEKFSNIEWNLKSFFELDSMKEAGTYEEYKNIIDIGMTMYSDAYAIEKFKLGPNTFALIWIISYSTMDACPYASGDIVFLSIFQSETITDCIQIGENMSSGDPPSSMSKTLTSSINDNLIIQFSFIEIYEEEDYETMELINEKNTDNFSAKIKEGIVIFEK